MSGKDPGHPGQPAREIVQNGRAEAGEIEAAARECIRFLENEFIADKLEAHMKDWLKERHSRNNGSRVAEKPARWQEILDAALPLLEIRFREDLLLSPATPTTRECSLLEEAMENVWEGMSLPQALLRAGTGAGDKTGEKNPYRVRERLSHLLLTREFPLTGEALSELLLTKEVLLTKEGQPEQPEDAGKVLRALIQMYWELDPSRPLCAKDVQKAREE